MVRKMSRRKAIQYIGGGVLGLAGLTGFWRREDILAFFAHDAAQPVLEKTERIDTRLYPSNGAQLSLLGFGAMRFPTHAGSKAIDEEMAEQMVDYAYRHGVNYFDTAYMYHGGKSEAFLGRVLKKYPRDSFYLADKMPGFMLESPAKAREVFQTQLDRCQVEYFDNYFLHSLSSKSSFESFYIEGGVLDYLREEKARGRIRQLGFSFHGDLPFYNELMERYAWDCVLIQVNYLDWDEPEAAGQGKIAGSLYRKAAEKQVPCFVMEPVKGGHLAALPEGAGQLLQNAAPGASAASWAMRFAASHPGVVTVLSGMSDLAQVTDNIHTFSGFQPLTPEEERLVQKTQRILDGTPELDCTYCNYCHPCPYGVDISGNFRVYNMWASQLGVEGKASEKKQREFLAHYKNTIPRAARADHCVRCNQCLELCPQHIAIPQELRKIDQLVQKLEPADNKGVLL